LEEASANCPFVLIIDDLDHASPESAEIMKLIVERSSAPGLVIVVSVSDDRSEWISDDTARFAHLILEELSPDETLELMKYRLGQPFASSGIVPNLYDLFGGIPMVILEEIKLIANALPLAVINDHRTLSGMTGQLEEFLSMNLEAMVSVRFQTLRPEEKLILQWISCFEEPCDIEILSEVLALRRGVLEENVTALEQRGFIRPAGPSDHPDHDKSGRGGRMDSPATPSDAAERKKVNRRRFRIRHRRLQSYVYNVVIKDHNHYHHSIAVVLDKAKGRDAWTDLKELGRQWDLCGESVKALACYEEASTKAPTHSDTAEMLKKALACLPEDRQERTTALMIRLAQALFAAASYRESVEIWEEILNRLTGDDERRLAAHTSIGKSFSRLGGNAKALQHFDEALSRAAADTDRFEIRQEIVALKIADGQYDEAVQLSERQRVFAARHPDRQLLASVETDLGIAQFYKGNVHESLKSFETTFTISKECKNTGKTIDALNNIGNVLSVMKDFRGALEKWRHALELITDPGPQHQRAQIFNNMGIAHSKLREFEEARSCYERAQKIFGSLGSENGVALTLTNLGEVVYADGNYERSLHLWTEALQMYREMQDSGSMAQTLLQLTQVYCTLGDANVASRMLGEAETLIQKSGLSTLEPLLCFLKGSVHAASNRYGEAAREYDAAAKGFQQNGSITGGTESELEKKLLALLRRAEMSRLLRQSDDIADTLGRIRAVDSKSISPLVTAETALTLGVLSRDYPVLVESRPLVFFRQGRELIEREQVSEISWKISCELGREYAKRGNAEKARENFLNAKLVIEYFASRITDDLARNRYLAADHRSEILAEAMEYQSS
jgi:tetratricopeptide (TPR) repeat protein